MEKTITEDQARTIARLAYCKTCTWNGEIGPKCKWYEACEELDNFTACYDEQAKEGKED